MKKGPGRPPLPEAGRRGPGEVRLDAHFHRGETDAAAVRRTGLVLLDRARSRIHEPGADRQDDLHQVRVALKEFRALLRLLRPSTDADRVRELNGKARQIGRELAPARDLQVARRTFVELHRKWFGTAPPAPLLRRVLGIEEQAPSHPLRSPSLQGRLRRAGRSLDKLFREFSSWDWTAAEAEPLPRALRRSYQQTRRAMRPAVRRGGDEQFHKWRIRSKYLFFQLEFFRKLGGSGLKGTLRKLDRLQSRLGADHDLAVLKGLLVRSETAELTRRFIRRLDQRLDKLRRKNARLGAVLFAQRPADFMEQVLSKGAGRKPDG